MSARRIYADHAATTPLRPEAFAAMRPYLEEPNFNPSSIHTEGRAARAALDEARATVARALSAAPREIVFTSSGTEANNLAIFGVVRASRRAGSRPHLVTAATEHHAVLHAVERLRDDGIDVTVLEVDRAGQFAPAVLQRALRPTTVLVSLMLANNEIGTLHPIAALSSCLRERGIAFHCDAVQAPGRLALDVAELGVDLLSLSGHKFYGPKGTGVLYVRRGTPLAPLVVGGAQEAGLRAGTENVAGIVGLARSLALAVAELPHEAARLRRLRDGFEHALRTMLGDLHVNGASAPRLPNVSSLAFPGVSSTELLARLDLEGVAVSAGSACAAGAAEPSHVLRAIAATPWVERATVRFSFGKLTSEQDVERLTNMLPDVLAALRDDAADVGTHDTGSIPSHSEACS